MHQPSIPNWELTGTRNQYARELVSSTVMMVITFCLYIMTSAEIHRWFYTGMGICAQSSEQLYCTLLYVILQCSETD